MNLCDNCVHRKVCRWEVPNDTSCDDYINADLLNKSVDYLFEVIEDEHWGLSGETYTHIEKVFGFDFNCIESLKSIT